MSIQAINNFLSTIRENSSNNGLCRISGKVVKVDEDCQNIKVILTGDETDTMMSFPNKSAGRVDVGDYVFIEYWHNNLTSGYVAVKCGDFKPFPQIVVLTQEAYDALTIEQKKLKIYGIIQEDESNV